ncbi:MAG: T9SS type A sorting domain-containing protein, partial [Bacteroidota bacterium]
DAPELRQHTYTIERALSPNGACNQIANGIEAREFEDTNLDRRTRYCYRVRTVNPQFESGFTEPVCGFPQPAAVATLDAGPNGRDPANALDISWTPGGPTDNLSYLVSVRPQGGEFGRPQAVSGTSTTISGLPDGVRYDVRVQSVRSLEEAVAISEETDVVAQTHIRLWPGDTNGDGRVDAADATQLTSDLCFGATTSLSTDGSNVAWQASVFDFGDDDPVAVRCDADRNGSVDVFDFLAVAANAGRTTGTNQPAIAAQITSEAHRERVRRLLDGFTPRSPAQEALKEELRLLVGSSETPEVPGAPTLDTIYPNPFAQEATVRLGLPEETHVRVELYNTLGQRVAQVANDMRTAGWHTLKLDAATLPSGPYLLVVQAGPSVVTKRVTVIR